MGALDRCWPHVLAARPRSQLHACPSSSTRAIRTELTDSVAKSCVVGDGDAAGHQHCKSAADKSQSTAAPCRHGAGCRPQAVRSISLRTCANRLWRPTQTEVGRPHGRGEQSEGQRRARTGKVSHGTGLHDRRRQLKHRMPWTAASRTVRKPRRPVVETYAWPSATSLSTCSLGTLRRATISSRAIEATSAPPYALENNQAPGARG